MLFARLLYPLRRTLVVRFLLSPQYAQDPVWIPWASPGMTANREPALLHPQLRTQILKKLHRCIEALPIINIELDSRFE